MNNETYLDFCFVRNEAGNFSEEIDKGWSGDCRSGSERKCILAVYARISILYLSFQERMSDLWYTLV